MTPHAFFFYRYSEIANYDYTTGAKNGGTLYGGAIGHFTQVVWKSTTKIAVGVATGNRPFPKLSKKLFLFLSGEWIIHGTFTLSIPVYVYTLPNRT